MKRFRRFLKKSLDLERVRDEKALSSMGITVRYAPDSPDDFDEFEFGLDYKRKEDVAFLVAIEKGQIARMLFGKTVKDNPDMLNPMTDEELSELLESRGEMLERFFEFVTA